MGIRLAGKTSNLRNHTSEKKHVKNNFPFRLPLKHESLILANKREEIFFGYVQCDLEFPDELKNKLSNFQPIFKNFILVDQILVII